MSIQFDTIPSDILLPLVYMEFAGRAPTAAGALVNPTVFLGQKLAAGSATAGTRVRVQSVSDAVTLFGQGSVLHRMAIKFFLANPGGDLYAIPLADDGGGTAGSVTITATGTATAAGTLYLRVGDTLVEVAIASGTVHTDVGALIEAALDLVGDLPVTTASATNVATVTSRHKGTVGNQVPVTINALGQAGGEDLPAGISIAISATLPSNGATDPTSATWITGMGDDAYDVVCPALTTSGMMSVLKTEMARRWGPLVAVEGHAIAAVLDSAGDLATYALARNDKHLTVLGIKETAGWLTPAFEIAASAAGVAALYLGNDPGAPLQGLQLPGCVCTGTAFTATERQTLAEAGCATLTVQSGDVYLESEVTTYTLDGSSQPDAAWQYTQNPYLLQRFKRRVKARLVARFPRFKLTDDGNPTKAGQRVTTPKTIKGEIVAEYSDMVGDGQMENLAAFKASLIVERNATNRNRVDVLARPDLINQLRVVAIRTEFEV